jgi:hypothetical protein
MKKVSSLPVLCFTVLKMFSQPNGGFENWAPDYSAESPAGWQTLNFLTFQPSNPPSAFKVSGIDKHSGNYALKLKTIHINYNPIPQILSDTIGLILTGQLNISPAYFNAGFAYSGRPEKLKLWYKYLPVGSDEGGVRVILTKWNGVKRDTLAFIETDLHEQLSYTPLDIDIPYSSEEVSDTALIYIASSRSNSLARVGSTLYADDVTFSGWVGIREKQQTETDIVNVYPNPAQDYITFSIKDKKTNYIEVFDSQGRSLEKYVVTASALCLDTDRMNNGVYFYTASDKENKTQIQGKFNILK